MKVSPMILAAVTLLGGATAALAQPTSDCNLSCSSISTCDDACTAPDGSWITCGQHGVCDPDPDDDGWTVDNCPLTYNPNQANCDGDANGDACDYANGIYRLTGTWNPCSIISRGHAFYMDQRLYEEALYRDVSTCHGPDQWRKRDRVGYCFGFNMFDSEDCCEHLWGGQMCSALLGENLCHS